MRLLFYIITFIHLSCFAQDNVLTIAKTMPEFVGGLANLAQYFSKNTIYPKEAIRMNLSGKAFVSFVVDTNGKVSSPKIIKSSGNKSLDEEAIRVVGAMPNWIPGRDSLKKVNVAMNLPVSFKNLGTLKEDPNAVKLSKDEQSKHDEAMKYWNIGHKHESQSNFKAALQEFNTSLSIESENKYAMFDKAKMLMLLGEKENACELWNKMIQKNIRKDEAEEFVKTYCVDDGQKKMAKYYDKLKASNFFEDGMVVLRTGRYEAPLNKFDSSLKYNPEHKDALFNKAIMHFKLDQKITACKTWRQLLSITPGDKEIEGLINKHCN